ncbi:MAG: ECF-type sigma factor [Terriglobia bacterium]
MNCVFGGLGTKEIAELLQISTRTVEREWSLAQAWLLRELSRDRVKVQAVGW